MGSKNIHVQILGQEWLIKVSETLSIMKTRLKLKSFQLKILIFFFLYFCSKYRLWVLIRTALLFSSRNKKK